MPFGIQQGEELFVMGVDGDGIRGKPPGDEIAAHLGNVGGREGDFRNQICRRRRGRRGKLELLMIVDDQAGSHVRAAPTRNGGETQRPFVKLPGTRDIGDQKPDLRNARNSRSGDVFLSACDRLSQQAENQRSEDTKGPRWSVLSNYV